MTPAPERLYVYAIVAGDARLPSDLAGELGEHLRLVPCGELAAVVAPASTADTPTAQRILRHEAVVEAIRRNTSALPVRFGTMLPDSSAVEQAIKERHDTLRADLERLGDKLEYGINVLELAASSHETDEAPSLPGPASVPGKGPGASYLRALQQQDHREDTRRTHARELADALQQALRPHTIDWRSILLPTPRLLLRAAYLITPGAQQEFLSAWSHVQSSYPAYRFLLTGPWPPYSFVTRNGNDLLSTLFEAGDP